MSTKMTFDEDGIAADGSGISLKDYARHLEADYHALAAATPDWQKTLAQFVNQHLEPNDLWQVFPAEARELDLPEPDWL